jgi:glycerol dehydrogenase
MLNINTPSVYISEPGAIQVLGEQAERLLENKEKKALIIWSKTAKAKTEEIIKADLEKHGIVYEEEVFAGYPSEAKAKQYAKIAAEKKVNLIIAFGGGKVMDVAKATKTYSGAALVNVPTIAATCAAWAAVSIIYTDAGDFDKFLFNPASPDVIIADTAIIAKAPIRYIKAGIVDTMAKWYEPVYQSTGTFTTQISKNTAYLAFDFLVKEGENVVAKLEQGIIDENTSKAIDAIIYLAGNIGSYVGSEAFSGMAHPFYHSSRRFESTYQRLHGEVVAFGLIFQGVYEERSAAEIQERIQIFEKFDNLYSLEEVGLTTEEQLQVIAKRILEQFQGKTAAAEEVEKIVRALKETDKCVRNYRG